MCLHQFAFLCVSLVCRVASSSLDPDARSWKPLPRNAKRDLISDSAEYRQEPSEIIRAHAESHEPRPRVPNSKKK